MQCEVFPEENLAGQASAPKTEKLMGEVVYLTQDDNPGRPHSPWGRKNNFFEEELRMQNNFRTLLTLVLAVALVVFAAQAQATNLVVNGDFELGNQDFTSAYTYVAPGGSLVPEGTYAVGGDPNAYHGSWSSFGPFTGSKMMIINGATVANVNVWAQTVTVQPNTTYYFSALVASNFPDSPAILDFSINGSSIGLPLTASTTPGVWDLFYATWSSGSNTTAALALVNQNTAFSGNDFSLDRIQMDTVIPTPLPGTALFLGTGLIGLIAYRRQKS